MLPPGYLNVVTTKKVDGFMNEFMHLGGWLVVHPNNSCEINVMDAVAVKDVEVGKFVGEDKRDDESD